MRATKVTCRNRQNAIINEFVLKKIKLLFLKEGNTRAPDVFSLDAVTHFLAHTRDKGARAPSQVPFCSVTFTVIVWCCNQGHL